MGATVEDEIVTPVLPTSVQKRDGRREPFDADKISQSLYAATEAIGSPNAFLARELTDGVVHFLGQENTAETIATEQVAELVGKVVRELGQPALAQAYGNSVRARERTMGAEKTPAEGNVTFSLTDAPATVARNCLEEYSLQAVYSRDIAAAHRMGLLNLSGLETPDLLDAVVVEPPPANASVSPWSVGWSQARKATRQAQRLVVDSPELMIATSGRGWLEGFTSGLQDFERSAYLNLRTASPPKWAVDLTSGPLFANVSVPDAANVDAIAAISEEEQAYEHYHLRWHLRGSDFEDPKGCALVREMVLHESRQELINFNFDRAKKPTHLWYAIDRDHPAILNWIGMSLYRFLKLPEVGGDGGKLMTKLPSLIRMVASAGVQKRNFLRKHRADLAQAFLLERARLIVEPFDVKEVVQTLTGANPAQSSLSLRTACQILQVVREAAENESRATGLEIIVREDYGVYLTKSGLGQADAAAQEHAASTMLEVLHDGCFVVFAVEFTPATIWSYLASAWRRPHISQISFCRLPFDPSD